jgi:hypothetical protein
MSGVVFPRWRACSRVSAHLKWEFICQQNDIPGLPYLALEYHCPRMIHAALSNAHPPYLWGHLVGASVLAVFWAMLAAGLFRRYGWQ